MTVTPGSTGPPYNLPYPLPGDLANVPEDMEELADALVLELNKKLNQNQVDARILRTVKVQATTPISNPPPNPVEGDIVFVVP